jgi:hypothetical protein
MWMKNQMTKSDDKGSSHHVSWKDRLGLNQQWMRDIQACSEAHSTDDYVNCVDRFRNDIINIKNGPALFDIVNDEWKNIAKKGLVTFEDWKKSHMQESRIEEEVMEAQGIIRKDQAEQLYHFIIQTLELYGFGFYQAEYEGEYENM